jgi:hypothetical protein
VRVLWANLDLRRFLSAMAVYQTADALAQLALAQVVVFEVGSGATPGEIARVLAVTAIPLTVAGPAAGLVVDRWPRQRLVSTICVLRAGVTACAVAVVATESRALGYAIAFVLLALSRVVFTARSAALPHVVERDDLVKADAVATLIGMGAALLGGGAAALAAADHAPAAFLVAAAAQVLAGAMWARVGVELGGAGGPVAVGAVTRELLSGVRFLVADRRIGAAVLAVWTHRFLLGAGFVVLVLVAEERFGLEATGYSVALAVVGIGAGLGTIAAPWLAARLSPPALLPVTFGVAALGSAIAAGSDGRVGPVVGAVVAASAYQALRVVADARLQAASPDVVVGRAFAAYDVMTNLAFVIAGLVLVPLWAPGRDELLLGAVAVGYTTAGIALFHRDTKS